MDGNTQRGGVLNLAVLLLLMVAGFATARFSGSLTGQVATAFLALGAMAAAVSSFQIRLRDREETEKLEVEELARSGSGSGSALFQGGEKDSDALPARRSREQFERFFIPVFTVVLFLFQGGAAWFLWDWLQSRSASSFTHPMLALGVFGLAGLVLFLIGKYSAGLVRLEGQRLLGPGASYLLLGAYLYFLTAVAVVAVWGAGFEKVDLMAARGLCVLLGLLALETLITLLLEVYRPRVKGGDVRLIYESRLVGLLSHPEGLITTVAQALDYQFGFKVSETWFYRFMERALAWLILAQLGLLLVSTSFVVVEAGDEALLERFGKPIEGRDVLGPGFHLKMPWPIDQVHRFRTRQVQTVFVGLEHKELGDGHGEAAREPVLWTVRHAAEEFLLLVASRDSQVSTNDANGKRRPPVSLLSASIPVQYQVTDLRAWAYNYSDADALLERVATREVVRYLVSADLQEIMSEERSVASTDLERNIQARADQLGLGVKILFVGLADLHPPVAVAGSYEAVVGARQRREADILAAQAHRLRTNALASASAQSKVRTAEAERLRVGATAQAQADLFLTQIPVYQASPEVYLQRAYLGSLSRGSVDSRKVIIASTNTQNVIEYDFQGRLGSELLDQPLTPGR